MYLQLVESSEEHNTPQVINDINDGRLIDINEIQDIFTVENVTVPIKSNITEPQKSSEKRSYNQNGQIENSTNEHQAISKSLQKDDDKFELFTNCIVGNFKTLPLNIVPVCQENMTTFTTHERLDEFTVTNQTSQTYDYMPQLSPDLFSEQSISSSWLQISDNENGFEAETSDILSLAIRNTFF